MSKYDRYNLDKLVQDFQKAGIPVANIHLYLDENDREQWTLYNSEREVLPLSTKASDVIRTHDPKIIHWLEDASFKLRVESIGATPKEVFRFEIMQLTGYSINVTVIGVDRDNGVLKKVSGDFTIKRLSVGPILVGETINPPHQDTVAGTWKIDRTFVTENSKTYGVIWVVGAAGRTIDWLVRGNMLRFSPSVPEELFPTGVLE